jgi:prophage tail gpP-like protein
MARTDNPFVGGSSPICTVVISGREYLAREWVVTDDILTLGDPFSCTIPNIDPITRADGALSGLIHLGDPLEVFEADPNVGGGAKTRVLKGRVTAVEHTSDITGGSVLMVTGADLGWHLNHTGARPFLNLRRATFDRLLAELKDPSWGIVGVRAENDTSRRLKLGRVQAVINAQPNVVDPPVIPKIQTEPGELIADILIRFAQRERLLVNVSPDGYLQFFRPRYDTEPLYRFEYHGSDRAARVRNNIERPRILESIDHVYTEVRCYSTTVLPPTVRNTADPNEGYFHGTYRSASALPFFRRLVFSDPEQLNQEKANARARWRFERGIFDAWLYESSVDGHSQRGGFFIADTMAEINDTFHKVQGRFYVSSVQRSFTLGPRGGFSSRVTLHKPGVLAA